MVVSNRASCRTQLAIDGGRAVRNSLLPYGRHWVEDDDVAAVVDALRSDWLTTGPRVQAFERAFAACAGARDAVSVNSGTAALHAALAAAGVGPGDEVITTPLTFVATANAIVYRGADPVFADVDPDTLLLDPARVEARLSSRTKAILAVDYAGQPCDYDALRDLARSRRLVLIADACHALGASDRGRPVGSLADLNTFSFHPVKVVTAGEGGMVSTDRSDYAECMRRFRQHGIGGDHHARARQGVWEYDMTELGYNYRLSDVQCALGMSQLSKLPRYVRRRQEIAGRYNAAFAKLPAVKPLAVRPGASHAHHLYVVRLQLAELRLDRAKVFEALRAEGIGVNVHYRPVHLQPYYRQRFGTGPSLCPAAEAAYGGLLSLPIFPRMSEDDVEDVIKAVTKVAEAYRA